MSHNETSTHPKKDIHGTLYVLLSPDDDYTNSEAVIMTFSLNNFDRQNPKFKVALQWEKEFLRIVQDYQRNPDVNFTFAYMAEVQETMGSQKTK